MENDLLTLTRKIIEFFYLKHDAYMLIETLSKDIRLLSSQHQVTDYHYICQYFIDLCQSYHDIRIENMCFENMINENLDIIEGYYDLISNQDKFAVERCHVTFIYKQSKIIYIHLSHPYQCQYNYSKSKYRDIRNLLMKSSIPSICCYLDDNFTYSYVNEAFCLMIGYSQEEFSKIEDQWLIHTIYEADRSIVQEKIKEYLTIGNIYNIEYRMVKKNGSLIWVSEQGQSFINEYGERMIYSFVSDITDLKNSEINLKIQKKKYQMALKDNSITILEYDVKLDRMIIDIQIESRKKIYEHYIDYIKSNKTTVFDEDKQLVCDLFLRRIKGPIEIREHIRGEDKYVRKSIDSTIIYDDDHQPVIVLATARDITTEYNHNAILEKKSQLDLLTNQLNLESGKKKIIDYLKQKDVGEACALMILDIDYFKAVNDTYGHLVGNQVLVSFSDCLSSTIDKRHIIIRIGGDEFMILLKDVLREEALSIASSICENVRQLKFNQAHLSITTSIGVCFLDKNMNRCSFELLFKNADSLLYTAKKNGRNRFEMSDRLDYFQQLSQKDKMSFTELIERLNNSVLLQETLGLIGTYYQFNCISFVSIDEKDMKYTYQNLWVSSRAYEVNRQEGILDKKDHDYLCQDTSTHVIDLKHVSLPFIEGTVKTVVSTFIEFSKKGSLLMINYDHQRSFSKEELEQIHKIAEMIKKV